MRRLIRDVCALARPRHRSPVAEYGVAVGLRRVARSVCLRGGSGMDASLGWRAWWAADGVGAVLLKCRDMDMLSPGSGGEGWEDNDVGSWSFLLQDKGRDMETLGLAAVGSLVASFQHFLGRGRTDVLQACGG